MRLGVAAAYVEGALLPGDVEVVGGRVQAVGLAPAGHGLAVPGYVDLQVNGFGGVDFLAADEAGYARAEAALLSTGVTAYLPTFITAPPAQVERALRVLAGRAPAPGRPLVLGAHLEGPFLSPERAGTHPVEDLRLPDAALLSRLMDAGPVALVTLAPELPGALEVVEWLAGRGVRVSCGHSDADTALAQAAFARGATSVTHLFNAMRPLRARDPGLAGAGLAHDGVVLQVIVDGVHLARETFVAAWRAAPGRVALVTDAIAAAGIGEGEYRLGQVAVSVRGREARRADGTLAGSVLTMDDAVRRAVEWGAPLAQALAAATSVPARLLGRDDLGTLRPGGRADVVVLDEDLRVRTVLAGGQERP